MQDLFLNITEPKSYGSKIQGHEGRHRMVALMRAGIDRVPVIFNMRKWVENTKPLNILPLSGQTYTHYDKDGNLLEDEEWFNGKFMNLNIEAFKT